ncbi:unnamed protein product [Caenorhabditis sp. 36 PRJEB53466]|nr:unnamed protein product [Caenorhabditis sp. 36 PRJEB53466]
MGRAETKIMLASPGPVSPGVAPRGGIVSTLSEVEDCYEKSRMSSWLPATLGPIYKMLAGAAEEFEDAQKKQLEK